MRPLLFLLIWKAQSGSIGIEMVKAKYIETERRRQRKLVESGRCMACGEPVEIGKYGGKSRCAKHITYQAQWQANRRAKIKADRTKGQK